MKTNQSAHPRLTCRLVRGWIAVFGETPVGRSRSAGSAHVHRCEDCQAYFAANHDLDRALQAAAAARSREAPANLEQGIMRAVGASARSSRPAAIPIWLLAAGAATGMALAIFLLPRPAMAPKPASVATIPAVNPAVAIVAVQQRLWGSLMDGSDALVEANPVQDEVDGVYADTKSALHFLAMNFTPSDPKKSTDNL